MSVFHCVIWKATLPLLNKDTSVSAICDVCCEHNMTYFLCVQLIHLHVFTLLSSWCRCHGQSRGMGVTWQHWSCFHTQTSSASCSSAEVVAEHIENGRVNIVGFAWVPRLSGATRCLCEGSTLSAHLLPPLPSGHPRLTWRAALPWVQDVGGVCRGWAPQQHPSCAPVRWHQAEASEGWSWARSLHKWDIWSRGQSARQRDQGAGHPRSTTPASSG